MSINETVTLIKDIVLGLSALGTVSIAVYGVKNWARELKGKTDFEVSRQLIRAVYKFRDKIDYSRSPMTFANEFPINYDPMNNASKYKAESWSYVFSNRWKPVVGAIQELDAQTLEAEAIWGSDIKILVQELRKNAQILRVGMQAVVDNEMQDNENFKCDANLAKQMKNRVWKPVLDEDTVSIAINVAIEKIENYVRLHLKGN